MDWTAWSLDPSLVYVIPAGLLYWLGGRGRYRTDDAGRRELAFTAGLLAIVLALDSPLDYYADQLFWVHMIQHIILLSIAPPLILLGRPWPRMWRALPMRVRVEVGRQLARARWTTPLRFLARPLPAWLLFCGTLLVWHIPFAYDATLRHQGIHDCEHATFFFTGLLFWAHVIDPGPLRSRLNGVVRVVYLLGAMVVAWGLGVALVAIQHPIYGFYAALAHRPGGISALADQQIAGGVMWVPGSIPYSIAAFLMFFRWLSPGDEPTQLQPSVPGANPERPGPLPHRPPTRSLELPPEPSPSARERSKAVTT